MQFGYYEGNKLIRVQENSLPDRGYKTTKAPTDYNWQYGYDNNGKLRYDYNKGINWIWYNYLNLPTLVEMTNGRYITLNYTADGELVRKWTENYGDNTGIYMQEYINGIEYKNWVLDRIPHPEGAVIRNSAGAYEYEYLLKDHLGSNRVVFRDKDNDRIIDTSDIKQINHYYPFGMDMEGNWNGSFMGTGTQGNAYKYNGKEFNNDFGLGWYHYGARWYDPAIGRWSSIDPIAEGYSKWSPYNFVKDNPIRFIDPDGQFVIDSKDKDDISSLKLMVKMMTKEMKNWSPQQWDAVTQTTGMSKRDFRKMFRHNRGPQIRFQGVREQDYWLNPTDPSYAQTDPSGNGITFGKTLRRIMEGYKYLGKGQAMNSFDPPGKLNKVQMAEYINSEMNAVEFFVIHAFGHELGHEAARISETPDSQGDGTVFDPTEVGCQFENCVFGRVNTHNSFRNGFGVFMSYFHTTNENSNTSSEQKASSKSNARKERGKSVHPRYFD